MLKLLKNAEIYAKNSGLDALILSRDPSFHKINKDNELRVENYYTRINFSVCQLTYAKKLKPYKDKLLTVGNSGGATRQAITKTQIEDFIFYYPKSKEEQNDLITKLDSVYLHTQNLAEIYKKQIKQHVQLKLAILSQELQSSEAA